MAVNPIPKGYHPVTPILIVGNADGLLTFMKAAFGAVEHQVARGPNGKIWHADVTIAGAHVMLTDANEHNQAAASAIHLYVPDIDETYKRALTAGATAVMPPADKFYGDRIAVVKDASGILWSLGTHIEDVPADELKRREAEARRQMGNA